MPVFGPAIATSDVLADLQQVSSGSILGQIKMIKQ
jgi:hypothetical protein